MAHSSPQTFMWLGKPPLCHSLVRPLHHPLLQTPILRPTPLSSSQTAWPWLGQLSALRIFALMSLQAPVGLSSQTGVRFTAPPPPFFPVATYLPHLFNVCFLPVKLWSTESLILPSCPDGAFDQYYSWVFVLESIVPLESGPIHTNGSVLRWDPDEGGDAQVQGFRKEVKRHTTHFGNIKGLYEGDPTVFVPGQQSDLSENYLFSSLGFENAKRSLRPCDVLTPCFPQILSFAVDICWCRASTGWESRGSGKQCGESSAGWQAPSLCGRWPWREMKEVHVHTLAAQTGLRSSVNASLTRSPPLFLVCTSLLSLSLWF